ncbi:GNAT family N-acetyltransferase [Geodermatophilus ruber]|uniref:Mycothiol synthase n=1 Tax=Geodermatophilus ruber TaxID=504800 RepID=A0A1I4K3N6_9ACTN|nr:GNAT family N-acetyltransferase [Geodermatophilus ruber]SFL73400.1 mycothiol synthase [Geodermatophilus ruber]
MDTLPAGLTVRPLTPGDAAAAAALLAAAEAVDGTGEHYGADDLVEWWVNDLVDLARDGLAVQAPDGTLVGWATAIASRGVSADFRVLLEGRVHPEHRGRGIGRRLLAWQQRHGAELHAAHHPELPGRLTAAVYPAMGSLARLLRRAGFTPARWYADMERPLTALPEVRRLPGIDLVPFTRTRDEEVRLVHNVAFAEHFGSTERDRTTWQTWFTGQRAFRPELSVLAVADGAVVGYVLAYVYEADTRATGARQSYLGQIGVLPAARGRGVASAAIAAALRAAAGHGCRTVGLQVDSENATGAPRLYRRLGFTPVRTHTSWARTLPPRM